MLVSELDDTVRASDRKLVKNSFELMRELQAALATALAAYAERYRQSPRPPAPKSEVRAVLQAMTDDLHKALTLAMSPPMLGFKMPDPRRKTVGVDLITVDLKDAGVLFKVQLKVFDFEGDMMGPCDGIILPVAFTD